MCYQSFKGGEYCIVADRNIRKTRVGKVVSNKMQKTIVVVIQDSIRHRIYNKIVKSSVRLKVHDENNECSVGDRVRITETRPISKEKRWRVSGVLEKAK
jgi:small subunit ribosomal protein S17